MSNEAEKPKTDRLTFENYLMMAVASPFLLVVAFLAAPGLLVFHFRGPIKASSGQYLWDVITYSFVVWASITVILAPIILFVTSK